MLTGIADRYGCGRIRIILGGSGFDTWNSGSSRKNSFIFTWKSKNHNLIKNLFKQNQFFFFIPIRIDVMQSPLSTAAVVYTCCRWRWRERALADCSSWAVSHPGSQVDHPPASFLPHFCRKSLKKGGEERGNSSKPSSSSDAHFLLNLKYQDRLSLGTVF